MRALTLWRPWDTAILYLGKPIENRDWPPPPAMIGQRIALHSGKKFDEGGACTVVEIARSQGIADQVIDQHLTRAEQLDSVILGTVRIARVLVRAQLSLGAPDPLASSPWFFGAFGWVVDELIAFKEPVPCRGAQGLWTLPVSVEAAALAQEAAHAQPGSPSR